MHAASRLLLAAIGSLTVLAGFIVIAATGERISGLYAVVVGAVILFAVVYERGRYRSIDADVRNDAPGPGGGEPVGALPPGFRPTDEVFIDPTSGRRMRVYLEATSGNRRYMAED